ncbi:MAG: hypothetical protein MUC50_13370 [Myxococcota bacterium]|jgi:hypothetical protein|nr:hypothetical protein [Myxococcota bacterium]
MFRRLLFMSWIGIFFLLADVVFLPLSQRSYSAAFIEDDLYYLPPPAWLRVFSLEYNEAFASALWAKALVYAGSKLSSKNDDARGVAFTSNYLDSIVHLNPRQRAAYLSGQYILLFANGQISRESVEKAISLTRRGISIFPSDGEFAFTLGFLLFYEMEPFFKTEDNGKERAEYQAEAVDWIRRSALMPNAPEYAMMLSATLIGQQSRELQAVNDVFIEHLRTMLLMETDPIRRRTLELQLGRALGEASKEDVQKTDELVKRWKNTMPYIPYDLFLYLHSIDARDTNYILNPLAQSEELLRVTTTTEESATL